MAGPVLVLRASGLLGAEGAIPLELLDASDDLYDAVADRWCDDDGAFYDTHLLFDPGCLLDDMVSACLLPTLPHALTFGALDKVPFHLHENSPFLPYAAGVGAINGVPVRAKDSDDHMTVFRRERLLHVLDQYAVELAVEPLLDYAAHRGLGFDPAWEAARSLGPQHALSPELVMDAVRVGMSAPEIVEGAVAGTLTASAVGVLLALGGQRPMVITRHQPAVPAASGGPRA